VELVEIACSGDGGEEVTFDGVQLTYRFLEDVVADLTAKGYTRTPSDIDERAANEGVSVAPYAYFTSQPSGIRDRPARKPVGGHRVRWYPRRGRARERGGGTRERCSDMGAPLRGHGRTLGRPGAPSATLPKGTTMRFTAEQRLDDVLEREFVLGEIPGTLWTPASGPAPLILMAHNNALPKREPRLVARGRDTAARGYAVATIDAAECGDRPRSAAQEQARADLRRAMQAGEPVDEIFESFIGPLVEHAVPEWRTALDALLALPGIDGPVGYSGWTAVGIRLAVVEPRLSAALFFAGGTCPGSNARRPADSPSRCCSCCSGTTWGTPGSGPWTCSTPSAPRRRRCTPTWVGTPVPRGSRARTPPGSSPGT